MGGSLDSHHQPNRGERKLRGAGLGAARAARLLATAHAAVRSGAGLRVRRAEARPWRPLKMATVAELKAGE